MCVACALGACATRPVNAPIPETKRGAGYRLETRQSQDRDRETLMILAFSGGGTRAAAFSYGVLEELQRTEVTLASGRRVLDEVDVVTGVSGGSFTALAYGLYGDKLFDHYDQRFLKRDVSVCRKMLRGMGNALAVPDVDVYAVDVSFAALRDGNEAAYLRDLGAARSP